MTLLIPQIDPNKPQNKLDHPIKVYLLLIFNANMLVLNLFRLIQPIISLKTIKKM